MKTCKLCGKALLYEGFNMAECVGKGCKNYREPTPAESAALASKAMREVMTSEAVKNLNSAFQRASYPGFGIMSYLPPAAPANPCNATWSISQRGKMTTPCRHYCYYHCPDADASVIAGGRNQP